MNECKIKVIEQQLSYKRSQCKQKKWLNAEQTST